MSGKRKRRTAEEAREAILEAAVVRLRETGPDGVRLADIARDVGVSHPAVLHHFGSRENLLAEVVREALDRLHAELLHVIENAEASEASSFEILNTMANTLETAGHARIMAWLALSGRAPDFDEERLRELVQVIHRRRLEDADPQSHPDPESTLFIALLATHAVFGEALLGPMLRTSAGLGDDAEVSQRFRRWLARTLVELIEK